MLFKKKDTYKSITLLIKIILLLVIWPFLGNGKKKKKDQIQEGENTEKNPLVTLQHDSFRHMTYSPYKLPKNYLQKFFPI